MDGTGKASLFSHHVAPTCWYPAAARLAQAAASSERASAAQAIRK
jgi:hypothetical protein